MGSQSFYPGLTMCVSKAGFAAGTTTTYTTAAAASGFINSVYATALAAQTNTASPTTDVNGDAFTAVGVSEASVFVAGIIAAGTIVVAQGEVVAMDTDTNEPLHYPQFPDIPDTMLPFGYVIIKNGSTGSAWTYGASNWAATGVVDTFADIALLPDRPQET